VNTWFQSLLFKRVNVCQYNPGAPCAKKELEEMDVKTARVKQILAQVMSSKCGGAVQAERDFWQQRVFRIMSSAVLSEARAKLYEPSVWLYKLQKLNAVAPELASAWFKPLRL
jgi:hypothetical protein